MKLIIAEKAIAGRRIAEILAGKPVPQTLKGKAVAFEFEKDKTKYMVLPLRGHIMDVDFPKQYSYWIGTDLRKLNVAEIEYIATEKYIVSALKSSAKDATEVIIATDADKEGEAIGVEALEHVVTNNPKVKVSRAYFSAITPKDINTAFSALSKVDYALADSANARREIDLVWGAVLTRFISIVSGRLGKEFLSAGRVQTPALAIIVDKEKERLKFVKHKYWEVLAEFEKDKKKFDAQHKKGRFLKQEEAEAVLKKRTDKCFVTNVKSTIRNISKPTPFNTTAFQRAAASIDVNVGEAMNIAELLYQQGYISYPRTDNCAYPPTLSLSEVLNEIAKISEFEKLAEKISALGKLQPSRGKETKDHPPIYPVTAAPKEKLSDRQWKIYELIVRRFLATLAEDAVTENTTAEIDMGGEPFVARGQVVMKSGWKEFYHYSVLKEVILPKLKKGDVVTLLKLDSLEKETQPPARYSQASLIKIMEELGLGTKATRHEIIKKLYSRQYITGIKAIEPNKIAFSVIDALEKYAGHVAKPEMTSELENEMELIASNQKKKNEVVEESRKFLSKILDELLEKKDAIGTDLRKALRADSIIGNCPTCGGQLRTIMSRNNKRFLGCTNYPKCTTTFPLPQKGKIVPTDGICEHCNAPMIKVFGSRYRYEMCVTMGCKSKDHWKKKDETQEVKKDEKKDETQEEKKDEKKKTKKDQKKSK